MERRQIDCPETDSREEIDFERTPCGVVVEGCSRFAPRCAMTCSGNCARLIDRRDRRDVEDAQPRVLVVYSSGDRCLDAVAAATSVFLSNDQLTVDLVDLHGCSAPPPPEDYDAIVIGAVMHKGRPQHSVGDFISEHRTALDAMPSYAFVVGLPRDLAALADSTKWAPRASAAFDPSPSADRTNLARQFALDIAADIPAPELVVTMLPARKRIPTRR
jgi:hypothetical protein